MNQVNDDVFIDEANRIYAKSCASDFEMMVNEEFQAWYFKQPEIMTQNQALNKFWNERLN